MKKRTDVFPKLFKLGRHAIIFFNIILQNHQNHQGDVLVADFFKAQVIKYQKAQHCSIDKMFITIELFATLISFSTMGFKKSLVVLHVKDSKVSKTSAHSLLPRFLWILSDTFHAVIS